MRMSITVHKATAYKIKLADGKFIITKAGKNLTGKRFSPAVEGDCEDCERIKVNTHLVKP